MRKSKKMIAWVYLIAAGWFLAIAHAKGETPNYAAQVAAQTQDTQYKTPEDLLNKVPFLGDIPRTYSLGDSYTMKLSGMELRVDHMGYHSHASSKSRTCMVGVSYTTPVAFFTTRVDMPLFTSPTMAMSDWKASTPGDYVVYMSRLPVDHATLMLSLSARF
jgi:hypothetical protein